MIDPTSQLTSLQVENPWALRILINTHRIEQTGLAPTRLEADRILSQTSLMLCISADMYSVRTYPYVVFYAAVSLAHISLQRRWSILAAVVRSREE
jgi:hypothetical protein